MSNYYGNYNQYLGAQRCCNLKVQGPAGLQGPTGPGTLGPRGFTGPPGESFTGPTGKGCRGPTGPSGGPTGYTGPTGPEQINTNILSSVTLSSTTLTIPPQINPLSYYSINLSNGNTINSVIFTPIFGTGCQAIIFINGPTTPLSSATISTSINSGTNHSNLTSNITLTPVGSTTNYATMTIYYDGTNAFINVVAYI